jgi:hypothetical protein
MTSRDSDVLRTSESGMSLGPQQHILQLAMGYQISQALYVAVRLAIPDRLFNGPRSTEDLANATQTHEMALYRILRALASVGVFRECEPRRFALTSAGKTLCSDGQSVRDLVLWTLDPFHYRIYSELLTSAKTGSSACESIFGTSVFEYFDEHRETAATFDAAMANLCEITAPALLEAYDFSTINTLVDVAGGQGTLLMEILRQYPALQGILCDSSRCLQTAVVGIGRLGLEGRCVAEAVDLFERVPNGGDAYLLKNVLHDWPDDRCVRILQNCHRAMTTMTTKQKRVLIVEAILMHGNQTSMAKWLDVDMLVLAEGRERSVPEFSGLLESSGFQLARVIPTRSAFSIIEAFAI